MEALISFTIIFRGPYYNQSEFLPPAMLWQLECGFVQITTRYSHNCHYGIQTVAVVFRSWDINFLTDKSWGLEMKEISFIDLWEKLFHVTFVAFVWFGWLIETQIEQYVSGFQIKGDNWKSNDMIISNSSLQGKGLGGIRRSTVTEICVSHGWGLDSHQLLLSPPESVFLCLNDRNFNWPSLNIYLSTSLKTWTRCLVVHTDLYWYPWDSCFLTHYLSIQFMYQTCRLLPAMPVLMGSKRLQLHDKWVIS